MVTLCTVRTIGRRLLRCWAALIRPLATATWWAVCQVWQAAWQPGWLGPCVAPAAIAPTADIRSVACLLSSRSSTAMAQAALGGLLPLAGHRAAVTLMCTALSGSGCAGGFGLSRFRRGPPFPRLAIPVVTQWPWNLVQALACFYFEARGS